MKIYDDFLMKSFLFDGRGREKVNFRCGLKVCFFPDTFSFIFLIHLNKFSFITFFHFYGCRILHYCKHHSILLIELRKFFFARFIVKVNLISLLDKVRKSHKIHNFFPHLLFPYYLISLLIIIFFFFYAYFCSCEKVPTTMITMLMCS